ncbi:MAG: hypothetical protein LC623_06255 [Halobacteriales archaeon]|nr:hypothetical protein [Halobacteriales archaeon]
MRWLLAASFLLGCLAPLAVAAQSVPVDASWHASGAATLRGAWDAGLGLASLEVLPGAGALQGHGQQGRVEVFEATLVAQEVGGGPQAVVVPLSSDPVQRFPVEGDVAVDGPAKGGFLWVLPLAEGGDVAAHAYGQQARLALGAVEARNPLVRPGFHGRELVPRGGGAELAGPGAVASLDGPLLVVAFGPTVTAAGGQAWTGCRPAGIPLPRLARRLF